MGTSEVEVLTYLQLGTMWSLLDLQVGVGFSGSPLHYLLIIQTTIKSWLSFIDLYFDTCGNTCLVMS
jgi:hypothetical protein